MLPEVRMTRVIDAIGLHRKKKLSCAEAGELPGISDRHFHDSPLMKCLFSWGDGPSARSR
jgi:hypothetical protein